MSTTPVFTLKNSFKSKQLTYAEATEVCPAEKLDAMIDEALKYVNSRKGSAKEYALSAHETLVISFNSRF